MAVNDSAGFDWSDETSIAVRPQDAIAVYANEANEIVIRRQKDWNEEEDRSSFCHRHMFANSSKR